MTENQWWDTIPQETVEELHIRQHPNHNPKKPRPECPLCWQAYSSRLNELMHPKGPKPPTPNESDVNRKDYDPLIRKVIKRMRYWPNEE